MMRGKGKMKKAGPPLNQENPSPIEIPSLSQISCFQLNMHKSKNCNFYAAKVLEDEVKKQNPFIFFAQEPNAEGGTLHYLKSRNDHCITYTAPSNDRSDWPRAALFVSKELDFFKLPNLCNRDSAVGLLRSKITGRNSWQNENIILFSGYWPGEDKSIPESWENAIKLSREKGHKIVFSVDSNCHSRLFGAKENNKRGSMLNGFITRHNLIPINNSNEATWSNKRHESTIDLTFASADLANSIFNWAVSEEYAHSDHKMIKYLLKAEKPMYELKRNTHNIDWNKYSNLLDISMPDTTAKPIDSLQRYVDTVKDFQVSINEGISHVAPLKRVRIRSKVDDIWNDELQKAHDRCRQARANQRKDPTENSSVEVCVAESNFSSLRKFYTDKQSKEFLNNVNTPAKMAKLNKIINNDDRHSLGLLKKPDGSLTENIEQSINVMYDKCFPDSTEYNRSSEEEDEEETRLSEEIGAFNAPSVPWITEKRIKRVLRSYAPHKSAGPDEIKPIMLENMPDRAFSTLKDIFLAMLHTGYTPYVWKKANCTFIPKTGKDSYIDPGSFRPITLSSHVLKTFEKLVLYHIIDENLRNNPLSSRQHAFQSGRSTESIALELIGAIERAMFSDKLSAAIFLDISQAFDAVSPDAVIEAMRTKGIDHKIVDWYGNFISKRISTCNFKNAKVSRLIRVGCPQGGILSPLAWNLVFDTLIRDVGHTSTQIFAFADDGTLLACGESINDIFRRLNVALKVVERWARRVGLAVSEKKTVAMIFTNRRKMDEMNVTLKYKDYCIPIVSKTKYLGLILDSKLSWKDHLLEKEHQARKLFHVYKRAFSGKWGPNPNILRWMWTNITRPKLTYGATIWSQSINTVSKISMLQKIQRAALMRLGQFRMNTPGPVLEVITNVPPLHLFLRECALKGAVRNRDFLTQDWSGYREKWKKAKGQHILTVKEGTAFMLKKELKQLGCDIKCSFDQIPKIRALDRNFDIRIGDGLGTRPQGAVIAWTDGSKLDGKAGAGIFVQLPDAEDVRTGVRLDDYCTVFQCEIFAIRMAAEVILRAEPEEEDVVFFVDSQAALLSLEADRIESQMVLDAWRALQELSAYKNVTLEWVRAHNGTYGNEIVDVIAKNATSGQVVPHYSFPMPKSHINKTIKEQTTQMWQSEWSNNPKYELAKCFFPRLRPRTSEAIMKLPKEMFNRMVRWISGVNGLAKYEYRFNQDFSGPECRLCSGPEEEGMEEEDAVHLTFHCPKLLLTRVESFHQYLMDPPYLWTVPGLKRFLSNKYVISLEEGERSGPQSWEELRHLQLRVVDGDLSLVDDRQGIG